MSTFDAGIEWLRRQGYHVLQTEHTAWYNPAPGVYQAFPYHLVIDPSQEELHQILRNDRALALRYSTPLSAPSGKISYHVVCEKPDYELTDLSKKTRYDVRKGLDYAVVHPIPLERLAAEGWGLREETLFRQGRVGAESREWWKRLCLSAVGLPGFESWGAIHCDQLVAALFVYTAGDCCSILYQQSLTEHLKHGVNNTLTYVFTREALGCPGIRQVFYGLHSLDAPPSVDEFKFRMGYLPKPVRQRVVFHPWLAPMFNPASHSILRQLHRWRPESPTLAKTEGMLRFYLEGKRPLDQQTWPEALAKPAATDAEA